MFFFIVPDVFLTFVSLFNRKLALKAISASLIGTLLSALVMFNLATHYKSSTESFLTKIPGISTKMISSTKEAVRKDGAPSVLSATFNGIPYKVFSIEAGLNNISLFEFLFWSIPARLERLIPVVLVSSLISFIFRKFIQKKTLLAVAIFSVIWLLIYVIYFSLII
jgi:undecaprenyl-diphosphatase